MYAEIHFISCHIGLPSYTDYYTQTITIEFKTRIFFIQMFFLLIAITKVPYNHISLHETKPVAFKCVDETMVMPMGLVSYVIICVTT